MTARRLLAACLLLAVAAAQPVRAADYYKSAGGVAVYLGVLPAEMVQGHSPEHPESTMHGGIPRGRGQHHVVVAVFDAASGARVTDAEVTASVGEIGLAPVQKKLERLVIDNTVSYGNYFRMSPPGPYRIEVTVLRLGATRPVKLDFAYSH